MNIQVFIFSFCFKKTIISLQRETLLVKRFHRETKNSLASIIIYKKRLLWETGANMKLIEAIGIRIDNLIKERENFTQYQLGKLGGISRATIWKIINPDTTRVKTVKIDTIYQIADTLGLSLKEFFDDPIFEDISD